MARKRRRRHARRHSRRRGYRRNPGGVIAQVRHSVPDITWGLAGFVGAAVVPNMAARFVPLPDKASNPVAAAAVKVGAAVGTSWLIGRFIGKRAGQAALIGGGIAVAADLILPVIAPALGLSAYLDDTGGVNAYLDNDGAIGYLNPGMEIDGGGGISGDEGLPERLNPANRF